MSIVLVLRIHELLDDAAALSQHLFVVVKSDTQQVDVSRIATHRFVSHRLLAVARCIRDIALPCGRLQHSFQLVVLDVARQRLSRRSHQAANAAHLLTRTTDDRHAGEGVAVLLCHAKERSEAVQRESVGVLEEDHVLHAIGSPLRGNVVLIHQKMDVSMTMRFEDHVSIFANRNLAGSVRDGRNAVLLHHSHVLALEAVVVVVLEELHRARDEEEQKLLLVVGSVARHNGEVDITSQKCLEMRGRGEVYLDSMEIVAVVLKERISAHQIGS